MFKFCTSATCLAALVITSTLALSAADGDRYWPQWRGPEGTGVSKLAKPPVEWSETKNIRWKKVIPGRGAGTPVIWGDLVFVSTAVPVGAERSRGPCRAWLGSAALDKNVVMALDRKDGRVVWERVVREDTPHEGSHQEWGTWASPSVVTDGTHVIASFESRGIYAFDMKGTPVWQKDLGDKSMRQQFGEGSSPALHGNTLVIVWDHQGASFIIALDKHTGEERWRNARDEIDSGRRHSSSSTGPRTGRHKCHEADPELRPGPPRGGAQHLRLSRRSGRPGDFPSQDGTTGGAEARADLRGRGAEQARRRVQCVPGAGGQRTVPRGFKTLYCILIDRFKGFKGFRRFRVQDLNLEPPEPFEPLEPLNPLNLTEVTGTPPFRLTAS